MRQNITRAPNKRIKTENAQKTLRNMTAKMHMQTGKISSSLRKRPRRRYVCGERLFRCRREAQTITGYNSKVGGIPWGIERKRM